MVRDSLKLYNIPSSDPPTTLTLCINVLFPKEMKEMHGNEDENESGENKDDKRKDPQVNPEETVQSDHHKKKHEPSRYFLKQT